MTGVLVVLGEVAYWSVCIKSFSSLLIIVFVIPIDFIVVDPLNISLYGLCPP